jgi:hypothetical protein
MDDCTHESGVALSLMAKKRGNGWMNPGWWVGAMMDESIGTPGRTVLEIDGSRAEQSKSRAESKQSRVKSELKWKEL